MSYKAEMYELSGKPCQTESLLADNGYGKSEPVEERGGAGIGIAKEVLSNIQTAPQCKDV